jgi:hypothetical protein
MFKHPKHYKELEKIRKQFEKEQADKATSHKQQDQYQSLQRSEKNLQALKRKPTSVPATSQRAQAQTFPHKRNNF